MSSMGRAEADGLARFPLITAHLPEKTKAAFLSAIDAVEEAHASGSIPNAVYGEVKTTIGRRLEQAYKEHTLAALSRRSDPDPAERDIYFMSPALHRIDRQIAAVEGVPGDAPIKLVALDILREIAPVTRMIAGLKDKVVKRVPKPVEERRPVYVPPATENASVRRVVALLEDVVAESRNALVTDISGREAAWLADYLAAQETALVGGKALHPHDHFCPRGGMPNPAGRDAVEALTQSVRGGRFLDRVVVRQDRDSLLQQRAEKQAGEIAAFFLSKNTRKLVSIVEAKDNLVRAEVVGRRVDLGGMTGTLRFDFADGASFHAVNSVVWSVSTRGTWFYRTPLTFQDVRLAGGVKMPRPSEQRMNEVFLELRPQSDNPGTPSSRHGAPDMGKAEETLDLSLWDKIADGFWCRTLPPRSVEQVLSGETESLFIRRELTAEGPVYEAYEEGEASFAGSAELSVVLAAADAHIEDLDRRCGARLAELAGLDPSVWRFEDAGDLPRFVHSGGGGEIHVDRDELGLVFEAVAPDDERIAASTVEEAAFVLETRLAMGAGPDL